MNRLFNVVGLMSGTSGDGVDASLTKTDGNNVFKSISDKYYEYPSLLKKKYHALVDKLKDLKDLNKFKADIDELERLLTIFNLEIIQDIKKNFKNNIDLIGYHGQTIYHNPKKKISRQLGNGNLLSKLLNIKIVYDFRKNDILNGGQGAPLTPIFHVMLSNKLNLNSAVILNIGGILNATTIFEDGNFLATDIGPGMCLIDKWIRLNSKLKFDHDGLISSKGQIHMNLNFELENFFHFEQKKLNENYIKSFDINDFDLAFVRGLNLENGAATLIEYTAKIIFDYFSYIIKKMEKFKNKPVFILCGGGRHNKFLLERLKFNLRKNKFFKNQKKYFNVIDNYGIDGDFIESQAFAYIAVRSVLNLPISFPHTTGCKKECTGGVVI